MWSYGEKMKIAGTVFSVSIRKGYGKQEWLYLELRNAELPLVIHGTCPMLGRTLPEAIVDVEDIARDAEAEFPDMLARDVAWLVVRAWERPERWSEIRKMMS